MMPLSADGELVTAYATRGSENAFRALVARHVNLIYATAYRQVGDAALAEEITQNIFIALARKAPHLAAEREHVNFSTALRVAKRSFPARGVRD